MSFAGFNVEDALGWGAVPGRAEGTDLVTQAIKKEKLIKEIQASQEGLRAMLAKVQAVQKDVDKLSSGNEVLQMYIDNLTQQMAKRR
ncbi:hypothetical protein AGABI1DRAFT_128569 [Agaricus bisporus var. burnettii JB137-S8]|uniref:Uncharacterized protein n=2 Tax=Agaricus bisporus var. burnettii TaxID=192524 RepID=K5X8R8_AGABU|nr:uncharacterized protein AGABI1DRAFT_128569 [Agaricus bisporus var. burnettii JB137-S8]EKM79417.1 hypothetical protein AGABI1DRAFT_128569 [Agaricus bisporus var. burnettii JB137-S8]KAF7768186.1 hypothetical protein Agabi119p4_7429 [Agaricus bisporus var. burnettii]